jgi:hypothetical protein
LAFVRPLKDAVPRLELLGFSLDRVEREYEHAAETWRKEREVMSADDSKPLPDLMNFAEFRQLATEYAIESLDSTFVSGTLENGSEKASPTAPTIDAPRQINTSIRLHLSDCRMSSNLASWYPDVMTIWKQATKVNTVPNPHGWTLLL